MKKKGLGYLIAFYVGLLGIMLFAVLVSQAEATSLYEPEPKEFDVTHKAYEFSAAQTRTVIATTSSVVGENVVLDAFWFSSDDENSIMFGTEDATAITATHYVPQDGGMIIDPQFRIVSVFGEDETYGTSIAVTIGTAAAVGLDVWYHYE